MMRISRHLRCAAGTSKTRLGRAGASATQMTHSAELVFQREQQREQILMENAKRFERSRAHNFSAGPASLPEEVLRIAQRDMLDYKGTGIGFMELSHRDENGPVHNMMTGLVRNMRELLEIPQNYHVLFFQGGAHAQFSAIPLNLCEEGDTVDYVKTGAWSVRAIEEAQKYVNVNICHDSKHDNDRFIRDPKEWNLSPDSKYVHITINETMSGLEFIQDPDLGDRVLVADATSTLLSRPMDIEKYGMIYASSGKNLGPAGICMVIVRDDLLGRAQQACPSVINWEKMATSVPIPNIYNTPPTFLLYMCKLFTDHYIEAYGSLHVIEERAIQRADKVYKAMENSNGFYQNFVDPTFRSRMNAVFRIGDGNLELEKEFTKQAEKAGIYQLFGHPLVGGLRITLYNGVAEESVDAVIKFMKKFAQENAHRV